MEHKTATEAQTTSIIEKLETFIQKPDELTLNKLELENLKIGEEKVYGRGSIRMDCKVEIVLGVGSIDRIDVE